MADPFSHHIGTKSPAHDGNELGVKQDDLPTFELCSRKGSKWRVSLNVDVF